MRCARRPATASKRARSSGGRARSRASSAHSRKWSSSQPEQRLVERARRRRPSPPGSAARARCARARSVTAIAVHLVAPLRRALEEGGERLVAEVLDEQEPRLARLAEEARDPHAARRRGARAPRGRASARAGAGVTSSGARVGHEHGHQRGRRACARAGSGGWRRRPASARRRWGGGRWRGGRARRARRVERQHAPLRYRSRAPGGSLRRRVRVAAS